MFSSVLRSMIPQMVASGQLKKVDTPAQAPGGGMSPMVPPQAIKVGPMQGSGIAVATPGGAPAVVQGGGFNSGLMSLLNDPNVRARLNLGSSPSAQEQSPVTASEPAQPTFQELYMSSPEYMNGLSSFRQRLSPSSSTPQQNYLDLYNQMTLNTKNINPFRRS